MENKDIFCYMTCSISDETFTINRYLCAYSKYNSLSFQKMNSMKVIEL